MPRLIDADALLDDVIERYCKDCERRKGIKNGKKKFIYDIGDAPCRACVIDDMKDELENAPTVDAEPTEEQVKEYCRKRCLVIVTNEFYNEMKARWSADPVKHGYWIKDDTGAEYCSNCHEYPYDDGEYHIANWHSDYCPNCGAKMEEEDE